jgi:chitinase
MEFTFEISRDRNRAVPEARARMTRFLTACFHRRVAYFLCAFLCVSSWPAPRVSAAQAAPVNADFRIVAYVASWAIPPVVHAEALTHINFAFARIDPAGRVAFENPAVATSLKALTALKQKNPELKVLVSVGGWMAEGFSDAALTDASRATFARSAVELLGQHDLDGIDLDWEYPGQGVAGIKFRPEDKHNFTLLLKALRQQLAAQNDARRRAGSDPYLLTIASADREYFDHTEMDALHVYLDWINIMSYDFFNSLTSTTGHHAGLYRSELASRTDRNADASVKQHLAAGIPARKLVLGVAFYGRGFTGVKSQNNGLKQPYERYESDHSYAELADDYIGKQGFIRYWDDRAQAPYLWNAGSRTFITYDDPRSIEIKAHYVRENKLGGMMFWELSQDRRGELLGVIAKASGRISPSAPP